MKLTILIIALAITITSPLRGAAQAGAPETLSVCDVLRDPVKYNGKMITVRGYLASNAHGTWLTEDCKEHLMTTIGMEWPNTIWVGATAKDALHQITFEEDWKVVEETRAKLGRQITDRRHDRVWVTYIGLFETWDNIKSAVGSDRSGALVLGGFGPGNYAPGQLIIQTVKDAFVEHLGETKEGAKDKN